MQLTHYRLSQAGRDAFVKYRADWIKLTNGSGPREWMPPRIDRPGSPLQPPVCMKARANDFPQMSRKINDTIKASRPRWRTRSARWSRRSMTS